MKAFKPAFLAGWACLALTVSIAQAQQKPADSTHKSILPDTTKRVSDSMPLQGGALKAVTVSGQKRFVEQQPDRTVVNVNALISNTGANALEVLQKSPGVAVDQDGNISYKGKAGVLVMIDDKPTYLSAANLATYLRSLPATALDKIELMDNPPAKYDAGGSAGVINIRTKKNVIRGFNGNAASSYGQGYYARVGENLNLNYRVNKVNLFANASYDHSRTWRQLEIDREYLRQSGAPDFSFRDISQFRPVSNAYNLKVGMDLYATPKTTWGIVLTGGISRDHDDSPVASGFFGVTGAPDSSIATRNISRGSFDNGGVNLNYSHRFDSSRGLLTFDLDFIRDVAGSNQTFINDTYNGGGALKSSETLTNDLPAFINIYAAKADFSRPLKHDGKFEAGLKASYVNTDNIASYYNVLGGVSTVNYDNTNHFLYKENINAAYVNYGGKFGRFSVQAGLRVENTNGQGHQLGNAHRADSTFTNHYTDLFPTAYVSYKLDTAGVHTLTASFGRRIGRANYSQLNPFTNIVDKFTYFQGNPFLRPQFTYKYKLAYAYKSLLTVALVYSRTVDGQGETIFRQGEVFISTTGNLATTGYVDLSASLNCNPAKWWTMNLYAEVFRDEFKGSLNNAYINTMTTAWSANINNTLTFGKGWSGELSGNYRSPAMYFQFRTKALGMLNAGIQKRVFDGKGSLKLAVNDIFRTMRPGGEITNVPGTTAFYQNLLDTRVATLTLTYNFGKAFNTPARRSTGSADSEQGRAH